MNQPFSHVKDKWHGANPKTIWEKQILTLVTRLEFLKPVKQRRPPWQLINEAKELLKTDSRQKLMDKLQKMKC